MQPAPHGTPEPLRGTARRRRATDRAATWVFAAAGLAVVASLLGILLFLLGEALPLVYPTRVALRAPVAVPEAAAPSVLDEYRSELATLNADGVLRVRDLASGALLAEHGYGAGALEAVRALPGDTAFSGRTAAGEIVVLPFKWAVAYGAAGRTQTAEPGDVLRIAVGSAQDPITAHAVVRGATTTAATLHASGTLRVTVLRSRENAFTGERSTSTATRERSAPRDVRELVLDPEGRNLYGVRSSGELLWWRLDEAELKSPRRYPLGAPLTTAALLAGGRSLVTGLQDGSLLVWSIASSGEGASELQPIHRLSGAGSTVAEIVPSGRGRTFLVRDAAGELALYHSTSERELWRGKSALATPLALVSAPRGDGALVAAADAWQALEIASPHAEVSLGTLFTRVWYEDYAAPAYVWQSTGGTDAFEPKLSLAPLLVGTLKGTFYAVLLALPLGLLGALYTSQFMHTRYQRVIKPVIELMASLPSVVLGFLAGLWLAPRLEEAFAGLLLAALLLPSASIAAGAAWHALPRHFTRRFPEGSELGLQLLALPLAGALCALASEPLEGLLFGGDFPAWLGQATGLAYEQRNAVVAGIAMGFAVIPIIFAVSEDALSNVPRSLVAASLALGATRWQTTLRVVLPAASPGLLAAVMIGIGRAIGETMIVLMATGNTPLLDWNAFNGFRTLSANIAVEIPEAPEGGTLYRTLFASALILFALTFALNTAAELVRERMRRRYSGV
jgi:phosphate transport system permease protein